ncbi:MAG TPA: hypothetical protein V6D04_12225, partial [Candidatus Obscuribacterales bacterium]
FASQTHANDMLSARFINCPGASLGAAVTRDRPCPGGCASIAAQRQGGGVGLGPWPPFYREAQPRPDGRHELRLRLNSRQKTSETRPNEAASTAYSGHSMK